MLKFKEPRRRRDVDPIGTDDAMQIMWLHLPVLRTHLIYYFVFPSFSSNTASKIEH